MLPSHTPWPKTRAGKNVAVHVSASEGIVKVALQGNNDPAAHPRELHIHVLPDGTEHTYTHKEREADIQTYRQTIEREGELDL